MAALTALNEEEIDDILWLSRVNDLDELKEVVDGIVQAKKLTKEQIIISAVGADKNTCAHYASANNHTGQSSLRCFASFHIMLTLSRCPQLGH
jgi:hypothetical protein